MKSVGNIDHPKRTRPPLYKSTWMHDYRHRDICARSLVPGYWTGRWYRRCKAGCFYLPVWTIGGHWSGPPPLESGHAGDVDLSARLRHLRGELITSKRGLRGETSTLSTMPADASLGLRIKTSGLQCSGEQHQTISHPEATPSTECHPTVSERVEQWP
jgi:hypothetical protein